MRLTFPLFSPNPHHALHGHHWRQVSSKLAFEVLTCYPRSDGETGMAKFIALTCWGQFHMPLAIMVRPTNPVCSCHRHQPLLLWTRGVCVSVCVWGVGWRIGALDAHKSLAVDRVCPFSPDRARR